MSATTIDSTAVYRKTAAGRAEMTARQAGLGAAHRQLLIVVDGVRDVAALAGMFPRADIAEILEDLQGAGLVETPAGRRGALAPATAAPDLLPAKSLMITAAREHIGLLAERLIARIELARSLGDLNVVAGHWHMALRDSKRGKAVADELLDRALQMLGAPAH